MPGPVEPQQIPRDPVSKQYLWWTGGVTTLAIPNAQWTPVPWQTAATDPYDLSEVGASGSQATSTIAVGEADSLPTTTITLTDATDFTDSGYVIIDGPPGASVTTVVAYSGKSGNDLTGCNDDAGISTGTLAAGQTVTQAFVEFGVGIPWQTYLWSATAQVCFVMNTTGVRGVRFRGIDGFFNFPIATNMTSGKSFTDATTNGQNLQVTMQPIFGIQGQNTTRVEVYQSSGAVLNLVTDNIQASQLMMCHLADPAPGTRL